MKYSSVIFGTCLGVSAVVHFALAAFDTSVPSTPPGADIAGEVALGGSFANLIQGVTTHAPVDPLPIEPRQADIDPSLQPIQPAKTTQPVGGAAEPLQSSAPQPIVAAATDVIQMLDPAVIPLQTAQIPVAPAQESVDASTVETVRPPKIAPVARPTSSEKAQLKPVQHAVTQTSIPPTPQDQPKRTKAVSPPKKPRGNAQVTATKGAAKGSREGTKAEANNGKATKAQVAGSGAANAYKANVLRRVERAVQRAKRKGAGRVKVGLSVAPNGHIVSLAVRQSSGKPHVDKVALRAVKKAGPFKPTPTGAQMGMSLWVEIKG